MPEDAHEHKLTATSEGQREALGGIMEGFAGMGTSTGGPGERTADERWRETISQVGGLQNESLHRVHQTIEGFAEEWSKAMSALDVYKAKYILLMSASTQMRALADTWADERAGMERADFWIAVVTAVPGLAKILAKAPGMARLIGLKASALVSAIQAGRSAANVAEVTAHWRQVVEAMLPAGGFPNLMFIQRQQLMAGLLNGERMATEAGVDFRAALSAAGGDTTDITQFWAALRQTTEDLYWKVFNQRGWHYLRSAQRLLKVAGPDGQTVVATGPDLGDVLSRILANTHIALRDGVSRLPAKWTDDLTFLRRQAQDPNFFQHLKNAVVDMEEVGWIGDRGEAYQVTVKAFSAADLKLLQALVDSEGDLTRIRDALGAASSQTLSALSSIAEWQPTLSSLDVAGAAGPIALIGRGASLGIIPEQPLNLISASDVYGITDADSAVGAIAHAAWGAISSPCRTITELLNSYEMETLVDELYATHNQDGSEMADSLRDAMRHLSGAIGAIERGQLSGSAFEREGQVRASLASLLEQLHTASGVSESWLATHRAELEQRRADAAQIFGEINDTASQLEICRTILGEITSMIKDAEKNDRFFTLNPGVAAQVESARTLMLLMMSAIRSVALPTGLTLPIDWGLPLQQLAELRSAQDAPTNPKPVLGAPAHMSLPSPTSPLQDSSEPPSSHSVTGDPAGGQSDGDGKPATRAPRQPGLNPVGADDSLGDPGRPDVTSLVDPSAVDSVPYPFGWPEKSDEGSQLHLPDPLSDGPTDIAPYRFAWPEPTKAKPGPGPEMPRTRPEENSVDPLRRLMEPSDSDGTSKVRAPVDLERSSLSLPWIPWFKSPRARKYLPIAAGALAALSVGTGYLLSGSNTSSTLHHPAVQHPAVHHLAVQRPALVLSPPTSGAPTESRNSLDLLPVTDVPAGMTRQDDSGPTSLSQLLPPGAASALEADSVGAYESHYARTVASTGQIFVSDMQFTTSEAADQAQQYLLVTQRVVDGATPVSEPGLGNHGTLESASSGSYLLFSYTFTIGTDLVTTTVQGTQSNVSAAMAQTLSTDVYRVASDR